MVVYFSERNSFCVKLTNKKIEYMHLFRDKEEESDYNAKVEMFLRQTNSAPSYRHQVCALHSSHSLMVRILIDNNEKILLTIFRYNFLHK